MFLLRLPGNVLAYKLKSHFSDRILLLSVTGVFAIGFIYISLVKDYSGLAAMSLVCLFAGMMETLASGYLHHRIDSTMRATMGSFQSLGEKTMLMLTGLGFGYFSSEFDIFGGYGFIAVVTYFLFISCSYPTRLSNHDL